MKKIAIYPMSDFYFSFLQTRSIDPVTEDEDVLHYFGDSMRKLKRRVKQSNPDLTIIHNPKIKLPDEINFPYAVDPVSNSNDIYRESKIVTNCPKLVTIYYRRLGLQKNLITETKPGAEKKDIAYFNKIKEVMYWE